MIESYLDYPEQTELTDEDIEYIMKPFPWWFRLLIRIL